MLIDIGSFHGAALLGRFVRYLCPPPHLANLIYSAGGPITRDILSNLLFAVRMNLDVYFLKWFAEWFTKLSVKQLEIPLVIIHLYSPPIKNRIMTLRSRLCSPRVLLSMTQSRRSPVGSDSPKQTK
jgi:hypothetical protein